MHSVLRKACMLHGCFRSLGARYHHGKMPLVLMYPQAQRRATPRRASSCACQLHSPVAHSPTSRVHTAHAQTATAVRPRAPPTEPANAAFRVRKLHCKSHRPYGSPFTALPRPTLPMYSLVHSAPNAASSTRRVLTLASWLSQNLRTFTILRN